MSREKFQGLYLEQGAYAAGFLNDKSDAGGSCHRREPPPAIDLGFADNRRDGAMVGHGVIIRTEAPDDVVREFRTVNRELTFRVKAGATAANIPAATVAVGNKIALLVARVVAACNPRTRRKLRSRRAVGQRTAAAVADVAVDRAVPPVIAL